jgi:hypothetical protein
MKTDQLSTLNSFPTFNCFLPLQIFPRTLAAHMATNQTVIENPVINSPFDEPKRHFQFSDEGITNEIVEGRRVSSYFIPIAAPKKKGKKQLYFDTEWTKDRIEENKFINQIRERISRWRAGGYVGVTKTTARLRDRDEEEVRGYRDALNLIHQNGAKLPISEATIKKLHKLSRGEIWDAGAYKEKDLDIIQKYADGRSRVRFKTVPAKQTAKVMAEMIELW